MTQVHSPLLQGTRCYRQPTGCIRLDMWWRLDRYHFTPPPMLHVSSGKGYKWSHLLTLYKDLRARRASSISCWPTTS